MEIGARLKEAREEQNISLDTLQETTKIQKRYLVAIEEGNLHILPGKFYARAFIKEYATAVGLDSNELLVEYKEDIPKTVEEEGEGEVKYSRIQRTRKETNSEKNPAIFSLIPTIIVVLLIIGIIVAAVFLYNKSASNGGTKPQDDQNENEVIINNQNDEQNSESAEEKNNEKNNGGNEGTNSEDKGKNESEVELKLVEENGSNSEFDLSNAGDEVNVKLVSNGKTWLDVKNGDDKSLFSGFVTEEKSEELDMSGEDRIYFNIGNASDLIITINGEELEYPVDPNQQVVQKIWVNVKNETE